jgi:hypothetical protein
LTRREAQAHAIIVAVMLWLAAAALMLGGSGLRDPLGGLKGQDFVHFYTLGVVAANGESELLYRADELHARQVSLVPESDREFYVPVYGPQTALFFAPLASLPYGLAALAWALLTTAVYALAVRTAWRHAPIPGADARFVTAAAAGFPPFWNLVLHGQTTAWPLAGFLLGWLALERDRRFLAGLALGLVMVKPQLGLVLAVIVLLRGEWLMLGGAATAAALQAGVVSLALGPAVLGEYVGILRRLPELQALLEPRPYQLHSISALTGLLPSGASALVWAGASALVIAGAVRVWRPHVPVALRMAVVMLASVLVSPHLTIYDATLVALPVLWLGGCASQTKPAPRVWPAVYILYLCLLVPVALIIRVQPSVFVLLFLLTVALREAQARGVAAVVPAAGRASPPADEPGASAPARRS